MDDYRIRWNRKQKELRKLLEQDRPSNKAIDLFFTQHAELHSSKLGGNVDWSLEDNIFIDLDDEAFRKIPPGNEHSIAWLLWHIARIEDVTMSMLVVGKPQLFVIDGWLETLGIEWIHTGNAMSAEEVHVLSEAIDMQRLRDYRLAVGQRTVDIIKSVAPEQMGIQVDVGRIQHVADCGAVIPEAYAVLDYWSKRTIAGLLLMAATRHNLIHLNEAERIKVSLIK